MAKTYKKVAFLSLVIVVLTLLTLKLVIFDFVKLNNISNITSQKNNKTFVVNKKKSPDYQDILYLKDNLTDKNIIVRCIGLPGDNLQIKNSDVYVNDTIIEENYSVKKKYRVNCFNKDATNKLLKDYNLITSENILGVYYFDLTDKMADSLQHDTLIMIKQCITEPGLANDSIYPQSFRFRWNEDNFGKIKIPYKGYEIELNSYNYSLYKNTILLYEDKTIQKDGNNFLINGNIEEKYTFEKNYYFMLNDVRSNIKDSRTWGVVPENKIRGVVVYSF